MSAETTGDSSKRASPEKEIQVSAAIGRSLMVSNLMQYNSLWFYNVPASLRRDSIV